MATLRLVAVLLLAVGVASREWCEPGWSVNPNNKRCYMLDGGERKLNFAAARKRCHELGAELASTVTPADHKFVKMLMAIRGNGTKRAWIGLHRTIPMRRKCQYYSSCHRKNWEWLGSDASVNHFGWGSKYQPYYYCVTMNLRQFSIIDWISKQCKENHAYVCEKANLMCDDGWIGENNQCFKYVPEPSLQRVAERHCADHGARLAMIRNEKDDHYIRSKVLGESPAWIGLRRPCPVRQQDCMWKWPDGSDATFTKWMPSEPQSGERCAMLDRASSGWKGENCWHEKGFICQKPGNMEGPFRLTKADYVLVA